MFLYNIIGHGWYFPLLWVPPILSEPRCNGIISIWWMREAQRQVGVELERQRGKWGPLSWHPQSALYVKQDSVPCYSQLNTSERIIC